MQQTRVVQGYDYYCRFVEQFPNVEALACALEDEVMRAWQGLGYYSRARNLHAAARDVVEQGAFPKTYDGIRRLKGVGDYTAAAIASFAFGLPHAVVDGNVYRVLSRYFAMATPIDTTAGKREFAALAQRLLDIRRPGVYNQALMDFGALQCVPRSPLCSECPLSESCLAYAKGEVERYPVKQKRTPVVDRYLSYFIITDGQNLLLHRRPTGGIWAGLYEPFLIEAELQQSEAEKIEALHKVLSDIRIEAISLVARDVKHVLTHRCLHADCYEVCVSNLPVLQGYISVTLSEMGDYPVSRLVEILFEHYHDNRGNK